MRIATVALALAFAALVAGCGSGGEAGESAARPSSGLYIALGDSLSEGVGASDPAATAFVPLVRQGLGEGVELLNLGHSGDTSFGLFAHGHLDDAIAEIERRNRDGDGSNDVTLVTLEIGGNDLLNLYFSLVVPGVCPTISESLAKPECVGALSSALELFGPNLESALDSLREADAGVPVVVATLYNPFSGGIEVLDELGEMALEGRPGTPFPEGLNDIIRSTARGRDVTLVDWHPLFEGKAGEYISPDIIHPNDIGYRVMADAVLEAVP